ncbi:hypothetical protein ACFX12_045811 [Malus domestica]
MEAFGAKTIREFPSFMPRKSRKMVCLPEKYQSSKDKSTDLSSVEALSPRRQSSRSATEGETLSTKRSAIATSWLRICLKRSGLRVWFSQISRKLEPPCRELGPPQSNLEAAALGL